MGILPVRRSTSDSLLEKLAKIASRTNASFELERGRVRWIGGGQRASGSTGKIYKFLILVLVLVMGIVVMAIVHPKLFLHLILDKFLGN